MKKYLLIIFCLLFAYNTYATTFRYLGDQVSFSAYTFDGKKYLLFKFLNHNNYFLSTNTIIKFKLKNDKDIKVEIEESSISSSGDFNYSRIELTPEISEMLKIGIKKIAINTIPKIYVYEGEETERFAPLLLNDLQKLKDDF